MHWLTIEVFDAQLPASAWQRAWLDTLVEVSLTAGARFWDHHEHAWGVVLEFAFDDEQERDRFREHPTVKSAIDATPDPVHGTLVYPHRGGGAGERIPRRPRPTPLVGAAAEPQPEPSLHLVGVGDYIPPRDELLTAV